MVVAAAVVGAVIVGVRAIQGPPDLAGVAWGSVYGNFTKVGKVHFIKLEVTDEQIKPCFQGWSQEGKTVYVDQKTRKYDDGQTSRSFDLNGNPTGSHPSPATIGMDLFAHLSRGFFSEKNEQFAKQKPVSVGDDFLLYEFAPPDDDKSWLEGVSVLVGKTSLTPIQIKLRGTGTGFLNGGCLMILFDYDSPAKPAEFFQPPTKAKAPDGKAKLILDGQETRVDIKGIPGVPAAMVRLHDKFDGPAEQLPILEREAYQWKKQPFYHLDITFVGDQGQRSRTLEACLWVNEGCNGMIGDWKDGPVKAIRFTPIIRPTSDPKVFDFEISCWIPPAK